MAKIITLDTSRRQRAASGHNARQRCPHKEVIAYTLHRTVHCAACGERLDPFDVLVDLIKSHVPTDPDREEKLLLREVKRRRGTSKKTPPSDDPASTP